VTACHTLFRHDYLNISTKKNIFSQRNSGKVGGDRLPLSLIIIIVIVTIAKSGNEKKRNYIPPNKIKQRQNKKKTGKVGWM
jgi:hypothetical protein